MSQQRIYLIAGLAALALLGLIGIQVHWLYGAYRVVKDDFDQRADVALRNLRERIDPGDELYERIQALTDNRLETFTQDSAYVAETLRQLTAKLDQELAFYSVQYGYYVVLFVPSDPSLYYSSRPDSRPMTPTHQIALYRPFSQQEVVVGLDFSEVNTTYYLGRISWLLLLSFVLITVLIGCFVYSLLTLHRQKKLSEMKQDFINNMTHEYKTPIFTISVATQVLKEAPEVHTSSRLMEYVAMVERANQRLKHHTERILDVALLDADRMPLDLHPTDVHALIHDEAATINRLLEPDQGTLDLDLKATDPVIEADPTQIAQVMHNLLDNARKYTRTAPHITVSTRDRDDGLVIRVADNGMGISPSHQAHVFDTFYRVPTGDLHEVKGFGLGLSLVKKVIEAHQGTIVLESQLQKGTCFEIFLPRAMHD